MTQPINWSPCARGHLWVSVRRWRWFLRREWGVRCEDCGRYMPGAHVR